jgi:NifB/MoaA-like Fe-S oxidoreductase
MQNGCDERKVLIVTGTAAGPTIQRLSTYLTARFQGVTVCVVPVVNHFFGERITVSGLVTGTDIMAQVNASSDTDAILIPINMLRAGETVLLDDVTVEMLEAFFKKPIHIVDVNGRDFVDAIINGGNNE